MATLLFFQPRSATTEIMEHSLSPEMLLTIERALAEDIREGDFTTNSVVPAGTTVRAQIVAKSAGVIAGITVARAVFTTVDHSINFKTLVDDGDDVATGKSLAEISGSARGILTAERTALNFLGRMSGIATLTRQFVNEVRNTKAKILDTRKTAPNLRLFDKMAVRIGGGENHRMGLFDMVLIKDNHIDFAGSITEAVRRARLGDGRLKIEVEARTMPQVDECLERGVPWIMLDNMQLGEMREAVRLVSGRAKLEASGNVTLQNVREIAETGVDFISVGTLTHSPRVFDVSLKVNRT